MKNGNFRIYDFSKYPYLNILHFDGQCLNGIKHGKCKEYNKYGGLEFEGEYLNGKKNGKGIKYHKKQIDFEGEYLNDKIWNGKGKEFIVKKFKYYDDGYRTLIYEGGYLNGKRNGKGKEYYNSGILKYEGEYLNGKWNGKGKEYNKKGELKFEGEYINGKRKEN